MIQEKHHAENPIKVTFKDAKCVKCGKETDIRLAEKYPCHTKEINHKHPSTEIVHTGYVTTQNEYRKFGDSYLDFILPINIYRYRYVYRDRKVWTCCGRDFGSNGCIERCTYCGKDVADTSECLGVCEKCNRLWGRPHGCSKKAKHKFNANADVVQLYRSHDEL
ncbi:13391_t:CDS:1 [Entrophospora sp. SA101]|nr:13391_t:CDS:1 [Entrophospora sp. SA101]